MFLASVPTPPASAGTDLMAGNAYRQEVVRAGGNFDDSIHFFEKAVQGNPGSAAAHMNLAAAYVDKIPTVGLFSQLSLGNKAIGELTKAIAIEPNWISYYGRAEIALYWPRSFGKWKGAVQDLETALRLAGGGAQKPALAKVWIALGDAYWRGGDLSKATDEWRQGSQHFPGNADLQRRLHDPAKVRDETISRHLDKNNRADTDLTKLQ